MEVEIGVLAMVIRAFVSMMNLLKVSRFIAMVRKWG
jgi:hypothetical protein